MVKFLQSKNNRKGPSFNIVCISCSFRYTNSRHVIWNNRDAMILRVVINLIINQIFPNYHTKWVITIILFVGIGLEYTQGGSIKTKEIDLFDLTSRYMISRVIINLFRLLFIHSSSVRVLLIREDHKWYKGCLKL